MLFECYSNIPSSLLQRENFYIITTLSLRFNGVIDNSYGLIKARALFSYCIIAHGIQFHVYGIQLHKKKTILISSG